LRDPNLNLDPAHCALAAFAISRSGSTFTPWSTFTSGAYVKFMREASLAAALIEKEWEVWHPSSWPSWVPLPGRGI